MIPTIDNVKTGQQIRLLMEKRGLTVKDVKNALSLACVQSVYHWLDGQSMPTLDNLYALSDLLKVPMDMLVCGNRMHEFVSTGTIRDIHKLLKNCFWQAVKKLINSHVNIYKFAKLKYNIIVIRLENNPGENAMPSIKPISDLRNYTDVLKEVDAKQRVYLTRNGHGAYTIMSIEEADELDRMRAMFRLLSDLRTAEEEADREGWISSDKFEKEMDIYD